MRSTELQASPSRSRRDSWRQCSRDHLDAQRRLLRAERDLGRAHRQVEREMHGVRRAGETAFVVARSKIAAFAAGRIISFAVAVRKALRSDGR